MRETGSFAFGYSLNSEIELILVQGLFILCVSTSSFVSISLEDIFYFPLTIIISDEIYLFADRCTLTHFWDYPVRKYHEISGHFLN